MKRANLIFLIWVIGGFLMLFIVAPRLLMSSGVKLPGYLSILFAFLPTVWLGGGVLLGLDGFRNSKRLGRNCYLALAAILILLLLEPFVGIGRTILNINRKTEYARAYPGAPECKVHISLHSWDEGRVFDTAMVEFAASNDIRKCRNKIYTSYSGPPPCKFKGEHVAIWCGAGSTGPAEFHANLRMVPFDTNFSVADFKKLTESLTNKLSGAFAGRVAVSFKEAGSR